MRKTTIALIFALLLTVAGLSAQNCRRLSLPNHELLSAEKVLYVMQDSEGFLWYATEGGGICRDDGRQVDVFRSDAEHPDLLGSNNVICLAEAGSMIIIGTYHGANVLDKRDYSIRRLTEVDDKRVDDIIIGNNGHWWLTANKMVHEYSANGKWLKTYHAGDKYIFRLHEDEKGRLWCTQWEGGTLRLDGERFVQVTMEWPDSIDFSRVTTDCQGRQLVTDGFGECYAMSSNDQKRWFSGTILTRETADSIRIAKHLSARPTALAVSKEGELWFSTGKDIRCMRQNGEETVIIDTKDVSAMTFTPDGTLWLATIFGQLFRSQKGKMVLDEYGSNEYGDGVIALSVDSMGRLVMVSDRYMRIYDTQQLTLRQQSREADGIYCIELQETKPGERWSRPNREKIVEHLPEWITSWWMWCIYTFLMVSIGLLIIYIFMLRQQRKQFLEQMKNMVITSNTTEPVTITEQKPVPTVEDEWLKKAIAQVEVHLNDESYTVEQLSSDMCMSRMTFYRRVQSLTGQSPTEFMRTIRLRRAAELLHEGKMTVTEISYATGFSSVSYFSRCFRTMFGMSPTQFGNTPSAGKNL